MATVSIHGVFHPRGRVLVVGRRGADEDAAHDSRDPTSPRRGPLSRNPTPPSSPSDMERMVNPSASAVWVARSLERELRNAGDHHTTVGATLSLSLVPTSLVLAVGRDAIACLHRPRTPGVRLRHPFGTS
jgi:hypothetical protein